MSAPGLRRARLGRAVRYRLPLCAGALLLIYGCIRSLGGRPCPCVDGQVCCVATNRCEVTACRADLESPGTDARILDDAGAAASVDAAPPAAPAPPRDAGAAPPVAEPVTPAFTLDRRLPRHCNVYGWCGASARFDAVWGSAADDVWVIANDPRGHGPGEASMFLHYDGQRWRPIPNEVLSEHTLRAAAGARSGDVWFVGSDADGAAAVHWLDGAWSGGYFIQELGELAAAWAATSDAVWAVGAAGALARWDGERWAALPSPTSADLKGVWGSAPNELWAVGDAGTLLRGDGAAFLADEVPADVAGVDLRAVWGSGAADVWAVGAAGTVIHHAGAGWSRVDLGALVSEQTELLAIAGSGASDIWVAGADGTLLHWDGTAWATAPARSIAALRSVWAVAGRVWAVGDDSSALHGDGATWWQTQASPSVSWLGVWGSSPTDVWAVGAEGSVAHFDGSEWTAAPVTPAPTTLRAVSGTSPADVWAVGSEILHYDGTAWSRELDASAEPLNAVWASSPERAWAVGVGGVVARWDGASWQRERPFADLGLELDLRHLWGSSADDVWVLSAQGSLFHWDGAEWTEDFGAGAGFGLTVTYAPPVLGGTAPDDLSVLGTFTDDAGATFLYWNLRTGSGVDWTRFDAGEWSGSIAAAAARSPRELWVVGSSVWRAIAGAPAVAEYPAPASELRALWAASADDVWVVGDAGTRLHREPVIIADYSLGI